MSLNETSLEQALAALLDSATADPESRAELAAAREVFAHGPGQSGAEADLARRRADEWFLLERHHQTLGGVPVELALHGALEADDLDEDVLAALVASITGVFEVTGVQTGEGVWVRDLLAFGEYPLHEPEGSRTLAAGDLLVGRLFPVGDGLHRVSRAAGVFRSPPLKEALERDLERARSERRGVLRLASPELERMFFGPSPGAERQRAMAHARAVLVHGGIRGDDVEAIFERLRCEPFAGRVLPGAADVVGDVLAELAFETAVDLGLAREALVRLWPLIAPDAPEAQAPASEGRDPATGTDGPASPDATGRPAPRERRSVPDARAAIAAFDQGRAEGRDLDELFRELERDLELEPEDEADDEADDEPRDDDDELTAPDFPGVVGALVEEYLWELEREAGPEAAERRACLRKLAVFAEPIGLIEELGARELLSFVALWLPEWGELAGADDARAMLEALRDFSAWLTSSHEVPLLEVFQQTVAPMADELPRLAEANLAREAAPSPSAGSWYQVERAEGERLVVRGPGGAEAYRVERALAAHLRAGDLVRGAPADAELAVYCAYPAAAAELTRVPRRR